MPGTWTSQPAGTTRVIATAWATHTASGGLVRIKVLESDAGDDAPVAYGKDVAEAVADALDVNPNFSNVGAFWAYPGGDGESYTP